MNIRMLILILVAIVAGAVLPIQAGLNVQLGKAAQQPVFAAFVSFVIGSLGLLVYLLLTKFSLPQLADFKDISPVVWMAGILGAFYVSAVIILAPKLGAALTFSLIVAGQMVISVVLDHYGFFHLPIKTINWPRVIGIALLIAGVILIRKF